MFFFFFFKVDLVREVGLERTHGGVPVDGFGQPSLLSTLKWFTVNAGGMILLSRKCLRERIFLWFV